MKIATALDIYRRSGFMGLCRANVQRHRPRRARCLPSCLAVVAGKAGLEIGDPSAIFAQAGPLPLYQRIGTLDNCNFAASTVWQERIVTGPGAYAYDPRRQPGAQFVGEASDLGAVPSGTYDVVLSSHVIEHIANPLKALREWLRVLKVGGVLLLVVPHRDGAFDHRRPVTAFTHVREDFERGVDEGDLTHLEEILALHDLDRDPPAGTFEQFKARSENNAQNRCLHHHVFDVALVARMLEHVGCDTLALEEIAPEHIIAVARKAA
ncbi:MAG TPA: class I SAM-dependent methyltransferase [Ramlibacter sp.]|nr:class I SAM-dependent methyltransferase [Ramlibacter sp.]